MIHGDRRAGPGKVPAAGAAAESGRCAGAGRAFVPFGHSDRTRAFATTDGGGGFGTGNLCKAVLPAGAVRDARGRAIRTLGIAAGGPHLPGRPTSRAAAPR